ncbi:MAG: KamA family radical SAM protein [Spirochaetales bacterium]|nr:KamA family radical SAM protein [Spirochaetales bacterium]
MDASDWHWQLVHRKTVAEDFSAHFTLREDERLFFERTEGRVILPVAVTPYYLKLADPLDPADPIRKQFLPSSKEFEVKEYESQDPLAEKKFEAVPSLIRRYTNRAVLRVTNLCAVYCRHCYRRGFAATGRKTIDRNGLEEALAFLSANTEIGELLVSGGDPLVLDDGVILEILDAIRSLKRHLLIRICTRVPVVLPQRITTVLCRELKKRGPLWFVTQFNHSREITGQSRQAVSRLISSGFPVLNQSVLLMGVNDSVEELTLLFNGLACLPVKPYYLFQGDLAAGTSHFRLPLSKGLSLYKRLSSSLSGIALPFYAVDLPGGGGKVMLPHVTVERAGNQWYAIEDYDGTRHRYPAE